MDKKLAIEIPKSVYPDTWDFEADHYYVVRQPCIFIGSLRDIHYRDVPILDIPSFKVELEYTTDDVIVEFVPFIWNGERSDIVLNIPCSLHGFFTKDSHIKNAIKSYDHKSIYVRRPVPITGQIRVDLE